MALAALRHQANGCRQQQLRENSTVACAIVPPLGYVCDDNDHGEDYYDDGASGVQDSVSRRGRVARRC